MQPENTKKHPFKDGNASYSKRPSAGRGGKGPGRGRSRGSLRQSGVGNAQRFLSDCTSDWASALIDPFNAEPCGVPIPPVQPSQKLVAYARGTMNVPTTGGFICAVPSFANDAAMAWVTSGTFAGTSFASSGTGVTAVNNNSPYASASFAAGAQKLQARTVALGLRVKYGGTYNNSGGTYYCLEEPNHQTIVGVTPAAALTYENTHRYEIVPDKWCELCWTPKNAEESVFNDAPYPVGTAAATPILGIWVAAAQNSTAPLDYEVYHMFEVIGSTARGKDRCIADPIGPWTVLDALAVANDGQLDGMRPANGGRPAMGVLHDLIGGFGKLATSFIGGLKGAHQAAGGVLEVGEQLTNVITGAINK